MIRRLVVTGGVLGAMLVLGCGASHPPINVVPDQSEIYSGYKGDNSRNGYIPTDEDIDLNPLWQIKFRYPLFYQPAMAGGYIFQPGSDKKIHVVDVNTGDEVAEIKVRRHIGTTPEISGPYMAICEEGERSELLVIDYINGKLVWSARTNQVCFQPALYNNKIFWVDGRNYLNAAELADGTRLWSERYHTGFDTGPIVAGQRILVTTADSLIHCYDIDNGDLLWQVQGLGRTNSSPACFESELYICNGDGRVACYDIATGSLLWDYDSGTRLFYSPSVDDEGIYFGSGDGRFTKLDRLTGEEIWRFDTGSPVRGTALISAKAVIFASLDYTVYVLDKYTGQPITSYVAGGMVSAAPVLHKDKLFIAAQDKFLQCFSLKGEE
jgi:outer membrane protein assembly factor BamB